MLKTSTSNSSKKFKQGEVTLFVYDHLGNTRLSFKPTSVNEISIAQPVLIQLEFLAEYFPYGKTIRFLTNAESDRYLTTQHERDKETGLDYRGARYYDSDVARFLSTDPWQDKYPSWSTYNYCMGNPIIFTDPTGKGVEYTKEQADAMAKRARKEENGSYTTKVVANPDKAGDYGVNYSKTVNGKNYEGVQYEGTFKGITGGGLKKYSGSSESKETVPNSVATPYSLTQYSVHALTKSNTFKTSLAYKMPETPVLKKVLDLDIQVPTKAVKPVAGALKWGGYGISLYNGYALTDQYNKGKIGGAEYGVEMGTNVVSTFGGIYGLSWGIGWELGKAYGPSKWFGDDDTKYFE